MTGRKKNERVEDPGARVRENVENAHAEKAEKGQGIYIKGAICKGR